VESLPHDDCGGGPAGRVFIHEVVRAVARRYGVPKARILGEERTYDVVRPRQIAMYLARALTGRSLPVIGYYTGGKDHATVLHAIRKVETWRRADARFAAELEELAGQIRASPNPAGPTGCAVNGPAADHAGNPECG
jgi:chromosomal replication initiation ATPase DnaA